MNIKKIYNKRSTWSIFIDQFGQILGFEIGLIICLLFIDIKTVIIGQIVIIPIIVILILSKYNKPVYKVLINRDKKTIQFHLFSFLKLEKIVIIPFEHIRIDKKFKWLLNYYTEILEIKELDNNRIIIPINKSNHEFIKKYLTQIELLAKEELIDKPGYIKH